MSRSTWACELKSFANDVFHVLTRSRSTWACELKFVSFTVVFCPRNVTLHVSVWVEIYVNFCKWLHWMSRSTWACELKLNTIAVPAPVVCHAPRERVSWNCNAKSPLWNAWRHAPRERVSWNVRSSAVFAKLIRHAPRERVSWNRGGFIILQVLKSHAPRERVSWNPIFSFLVTKNSVTLHVSVWVEISLSSPPFSTTARHAPRERVSWNCSKRETYLY